LVTASVSWAPLELGVAVAVAAAAPFPQRYMTNPKGRHGDAAVSVAVWGSETEGDDDDSTVAVSAAADLLSSSIFFLVRVLQRSSC
jgi:hypothetical protein